ncbi:MAG TPA: CocE/NonD family hydrolase [Steroidobacteraceae bacterium]|nr:CocE/NonD family hydrolase [Steroidobacteraceae bacterium]
MRQTLLIAAFVALVLPAFAGAPANRGVRVMPASIPMPDGTVLAATLYMPADLRPHERVPALLEYLPYRKDDDTASGDYGKHAYFARHGYVGVRVDIRGFGASGGTPPTREYSAQEQEDGEHVIAWLARQPWSNGNVGMFGISWGGFNSIQMAMRRPPALKAILAIEATEALFKEDVHYMDGVMHVDEFEVSMDLDQGRSGAPDFPLDEDTLARRMDSPPWSLDYFRHQRDGAFWRAPIRPFEDIRIPCFLIGGLQDGYRDSIPRMLERVPAPVRAWLGPWNHDYPNTSIYGPRVEWRDQAVRWFDHWLKGMENGVEREPRLVVYQQRSHPPGAAAQDIPGEWRAESWPPAGLKPLTWFLAPNHQLTAAPATEASDHLRYVPSVGTEAGFWWGELLTDQRPVDAYSLTYDSPPLEADLSMLGVAHVRLLATADAPLANWFVRLEDVADDGRVTAITGAGLSGAQRRSMEHPEPLARGQEYVLDLELHLSSWVWPRGHRIRVAVANAQWPMFWPTPYPMTTVLRLGGAEGSAITLPVVPARGRAPPAFGPLETVEVPPGTTTPGDYAWPGSWKLERDEAKERSTVTWRGTSAVRFPWGAFEHSEQLVYHVDDADPAVSAVEGDAESIEMLADCVLTYRGHLTVTSDATTFHYAYTRELLRNGAVVRTKTWQEVIPRDLQ